MLASVTFNALNWVVYWSCMVLKRALIAVCRSLLIFRLACKPLVLVSMIPPSARKPFTSVCKFVRMPLLPVVFGVPSELVPAVDVNRLAMPAKLLVVAVVNFVVSSARVPSFWKPMPMSVSELMPLPPATFPSRALRNWVMMLWTDDSLANGDEVLAWPMVVEGVCCVIPVIAFCSALYALTNVDAVVAMPLVSLLMLSVKLSEAVVILVRLSVTPEMAFVTVFVALVTLTPSILSLASWAACSCPIVLPVSVAKSPVPVSETGLVAPEPEGVSTRWSLVPSLVMLAVTPALAVLMASRTFCSVCPAPLSATVVAVPLTFNVNPPAVASNVWPGVTFGEVYFPLGSKDSEE